MTWDYPKIEAYVAADGSLWMTKQEARKHDGLPETSKREKREKAEQTDDLILLSLTMSNLNNLTFFG